MQEGKRQKQIAGLLNEELNGIFQRLGLTMINGGMVSIVSVKMTPDLLECRIYLSLFQVGDPQGALKKIEDQAGRSKRAYRPCGQATPPYARTEVLPGRYPRPCVQDGRYLQKDQRGEERRGRVLNRNWWLFRCSCCDSGTGSSLARPTPVGSCG